MKTLSTTPLLVTSLISSILLLGLPYANAGELTAEREARTAEIERLYAIVRNERLNRSARIEAKLQIARLEAEMRKERRFQDRERDRQAALMR